MSGADVRAARQSLGLSLADLAELLGYEGAHRKAQLHRIEIGERRLLPCQARMLRAYLDGYRPPDWPEKS